MNDLIKDFAENIKKENQKLDELRRIINNFILKNLASIATAAGVTKSHVRINNLDINEKETVLIGISKNDGYYMLKARIHRQNDIDHCDIYFELELDGRYKRQETLEYFGKVKEINENRDLLVERLENAVHEYLKYVL